VNGKKIFFFTIIFCGVSIPCSFGQARYSYIDENGVQNFTNIAPVKPVWNLKVTGSDPVEETPVFADSISDKFSPIIEKAAREYQLDPSLIRSIIAAESNFNPKAVSPKGARGLMQLMPGTAARLGVSNSFDPEQNIRGGVKHFRWLMDNFNNDIKLSLAAYNAGENLVQRLGRVPEIKETREYVKKITKDYDKKLVSAKPPENTAQAQAPKTYRFYDEEGVLHLTNIPPND
jgi:soluble lytic murein transglycosylase-like protein